MPAPLFKLPFRFLRVAGPHRVFWLGGPLLLYSWTLAGPFISDDLHLILKAERHVQDDAFPGIPELFRFAKSDDEWQDLRHRGTSPWWLPQRGRLDFLRPVTDLSFYLDFLFFGRNPFPYRLVSLAIFGIALCCAHRLYVAAGADPIRAGLSTFFVGISQTVSPPVTWICNRSDLLVVSGATLAAVAYWRLLARPQARWILLAIAAFAFALFSKEVAVALTAVIAAYELHRRWSARNWLGKPLPAVTTILLVAMTSAYLAYYIYTRPWVLSLAGEDGPPSQIGLRLPLSMLLYSAVWSLGYPIDTLLVASDPHLWAIALAGGAFMLFTACRMRRSSRGDPAALFFALWAVLFILPGLRALTASSRCLCVATVGWTYLLVGLIVPSKEEDAIPHGLYRHVIFCVNGVVSIGCVIGTVLFINGSELRARNRLAQIVAGLDAPLRDGDSLIIANAESSFEIMCGRDRAEFLTGRKNLVVTYLIAPGIDAHVEPRDDKTLILRSKGDCLFSSALHRLTLGRGGKPALGRPLAMRDFTAVVSKVSPAGDVLSLDLSFNEPLNSSRLHFHPPLPSSAAPDESPTPYQGDLK